MSKCVIVLILDDFLNSFPMHASSIVDEIDINLLLPNQTKEVIQKQFINSKPNHRPLTFSSTSSKILLRLHFGGIFRLCYVAWLSFMLKFYTAYFLHF